MCVLAQSVAELWALISVYYVVFDLKSVRRRPSLFSCMCV